MEIYVTLPPVATFFTVEPSRSQNRVSCPTSEITGSCSLREQRHCGKLRGVLYAAAVITIDSFVRAN